MTLVLRSDILLMIQVPYICYMVIHTFNNNNWYPARTDLYVTLNFNNKTLNLLYQIKLNLQHETLHIPIQQLFSSTIACFYQEF